jgi:hypothetical protein
MEVNDAAGSQLVCDQLFIGGFFFTRGIYPVVVKVGIFSPDFM